MLAYLVEHAGELVATKALFDAVWPGTVVTDGVLTKGEEARQLLAPLYGWFTEGFDTDLTTHPIHPLAVRAEPFDQLRAGVSTHERRLSDGLALRPGSGQTASMRKFLVGTPTRCQGGA
jgi:hypothetical protein